MPQNLKEICERAGTTSDAYKKAQQLAKAIPEVKELIESGIVSPKTARNLILRLSDDEQRELLTMLPAAGKITQTEVQKYVDQLKGKDNEIAVLTAEKEEAERAKEKAEKAARDAIEAKELSLKQIPVIIDDELSDEDDKLQQLIAANFGRMKNDPVKQGKLLREYERLRGVRQGSARQKVGENYFPQITQEDIAKELGVTTQTVKNLKRLTTLIPELQEVISTGQINATTGFKLLARLSDDEQRQLLARLPGENSYVCQNPR